MKSNQELELREPFAVYSRIPGKTSKPGRMTVEEYFGELRRMVDEYYDSVQG